MSADLRPPRLPAAPDHGPDGFEFALARIGARLAWRGDLRHWQRMHAARGLAAWLDAARHTPLAPYLSGLEARASLQDIDAAFRAQMRARIEEVARWSPAEWQPAVRWTAVLLDLPALQHLWHDNALPAWMARDPWLAPYAALEPATRREQLRLGRYGPWVRAVERQEADAPMSRLSRRGRRPVPSVSLAGWHEAWRARWPSTTHAGALEDWAMGAMKVALSAPGSGTGSSDAQAARLHLAQHALATLRSRAADVGPLAPFAFLLLLALDLQRLRAECVRQVMATAIVTAGAAGSAA